jgi:hypothetical protein
MPGPRGIQRDANHRNAGQLGISTALDELLAGNAERPDRDQADHHFSISAFCNTARASGSAMCSSASSSSIFQEQSSLRSFRVTLGKHHLMTSGGGPSRAIGSALSGEFAVYPLGEPSLTVPSMSAPTDAVITAAPRGLLKPDWSVH